MCVHNYVSNMHMYYGTYFLCACAYFFCAHFLQKFFENCIVQNLDFDSSAKFMLQLYGIKVFEGKMTDSSGLEFPLPCNYHFF